MSRAKEERAALRVQTTELLTNLGSNAEAVASQLESAGVKGVPGSGTGCAVARYVNAVMASDPRIGPINVNDKAVTIFGRHWWTRPSSCRYRRLSAASSSASIATNFAIWPWRPAPAGTPRPPQPTWPRVRRSGCDPAVRPPGETATTPALHGCRDPGGGGPRREARSAPDESRPGGRRAPGPYHGGHWYLGPPKTARSGSVRARGRASGGDWRRTPGLTRVC